MDRLLTLLLVSLLLVSCNTGNEEDETLPVASPTLKEFEVEPRGTYPEILGASIPKLRPNLTPWESSEIFCSENMNESFHQIRAIERNGEVSYVVFSSIELNDGFSFYFNEYDGMGQLMSRQHLQGADFSISDKINLQRKDDFVFYFTNLEKRQTKYFSLETGEHGDTTDKVMDWELQNFAPNFTSPSRSLVITLYDTKLVLRDLTDKSIDTLINQEYRGSWSFGQGCWNDQSTKFYFDNSGAVACIWELDVEGKALNKIVPEHYADHPYFFTKDGTEYITYCENNCIKLATVQLTN